MTENPPLTTKQRLFVEAYLAEPNGVKAARKAGYKGDDDTLAMTASRLIRNDKISRLTNSRINEAVMTADEVLAELSKIAHGDYSEYRGDKLKALDLVGKYHKLFTEKIEVIHTAEMAAKHYAQALDFAVRFALAPGEKTHATALAMLAENAKGNPDLEAVVAELAEKMNVKQISA